jgi:polysaccharide biosynthesis/export protein
MNLGNLMVRIVWSAANLPLFHARRTFSFIMDAGAVYVACALWEIGAAGVLRDWLSKAGSIWLWFGHRLNYQNGCEAIPHFKADRRLRTEDAMALLRLFVPLAAAAFLCACGASSMQELTSDKPQIAKLPADGPSKANVNSEAKKDTEARGGDQDAAAVKKVALNVSSVSDPSSKSYKVGPRDVLEVTVFKVPDLSKVVQVSEAGTISYPLVGEVQAGGRTAREIEQELTKSLGAKYLQNPQINVMVKEYNSQRVTVEGAVKKPGVIPIQGDMTLLQAVALAGGFEDKAEETILLFRQADGKRAVGRYDVGEIRAFKAEDPHLEAGDVLVAPSSNLKEGFGYFMKVVPIATLVPYL